MKIGGWTVNADYLIGRRFAWRDGSPDVTFVSMTRDGLYIDLIRAHIFGGGAQWLPLSRVQHAIAVGAMIEAEGAPFTNVSER